MTFVAGARKAYSKGSAHAGHSGTQITLLPIRNTMVEEITDPVTALMQPFFEYRQLSTPKLFVMFLEGRFCEMQFYVMLLHRSGLDLPVSLRDWQIDSRNLKRIEKIIAALSVECRHVVQLMSFLNPQLGHMLKELERRLKEKPAGLAFLMEQRDRLEELWIKPRRLKGKDVANRNDVKQIALCAGLEHLDSAEKKFITEHQAFLDRPPPIFPFEMDDLERDLWQALIHDAWCPSLQAIFGKVLPLMTGAAEKVVGAVDNLLRENRRKAQRREKIFDGKEKFPVKGPEADRAEWDLSERAAIHRHEKIAQETTSDWSLSLSHQAPEQYFGARELEARAYRIAARRAGKKGTAFLDALKAKKSHQDAAATAEIPLRTAERIIQAIKEDHLSQNR